MLSAQKPPSIPPPATLGSREVELAMIARVTEELGKDKAKQLSARLKESRINILSRRQDTRAYVIPDVIGKAFKDRVKPGFPWDRPASAAFAAKDVPAHVTLGRLLVKNRQFARVHANLRRKRAFESQTEIYEFAGFTLDVQGQTLVKNGTEVIELSQKEFTLLRYLTRNQGVVLSRKQILNAVWGKCPGMNLACWQKC